MDDAMLKHWYGRTENKTWRCEPALKALCATFDEQWSECTPAPGNRASWYAGLRKVLREFGAAGGIAFIEYARVQIDLRNKQNRIQGRQPLDIVDGHSIFFLAPSFKKLKSGKGDCCPDCGETMAFCLHDWGSRKRSEHYGGNDE